MKEGSNYERFRLIDALRDMIKLCDDLSNNTDGRYPGLSLECFDCSLGTVPNRLNKGPCAYHKAKRLLAEIAPEALKSMRGAA